MPSLLGAPGLDSDALLSLRSVDDLVPREL